jgi:hypothetical protein
MNRAKEALVLSKFRKVVFAALLIFVLHSASWASEPETALSARPSAFFYLTARFDDFGGMLRDIFSPANIEMLASLLPGEESQPFRLMASMASQIPAKSVALLGGMTADETPFLQVAASMPDSARPKLDRVASGKASPEDLTTLVLGEGGLLLAGGIQPMLQEGPEGPYYLLEGMLAFAARDDLLVMASSPADLEASLGAIKKAENRLAVKRRFKSPNYYFLHMDIPTLVNLAQKESLDIEEIDVDAFLSQIKAPLEHEMAFESKPGSILVSSGMNVSEILPPEFLGKKTSAKMFLAGGGKLLLGLASGINFNASDQKLYPEAAQMWNKLSQKLAARGITEKDLEDLLTGSVTLAYGNEATILGARIRGGYVAFTGKEGAASKIWNKILEDESFSQAVPISPLQVEGWESLFAVDPALFPASVVMGASKDTFFLGIADPKELGKTPELSSESAKLLKEDSLAMSFFDAASAWEYLKQNGATIAALAPNITPEALRIITDILGAELSVSFIKLWAPTLNESFLEIFTVDVPSEKRLLPKIVETLKPLIAPTQRRIDSDDNDEEDDEETGENYEDLLDPKD